MTDETNVKSDDNAALMRLAETYSRQVLDGGLTPYEGGKRIWFECQLKLDGDDHRLDPFVYWASEWEEAVELERKALCNRGLRVAATNLIEKGSAL